MCAPTRERALEIATPYLTERYEAYRAWGQDAVLPQDETLDLPFDHLLRERFVIGRRVVVGCQGPWGCG